MESVPKHPLLKVPPNAIQEIRKFYNLDTPERINEAIDILEDWINKQDHILKKDFGREYLERTLISTKGSVEKAKKQIDRLCTMRTLLPQFFLKTNVKVELNEVMQMGFLIPLPTQTDDFYRILTMKINVREFTERYYLEYFQYSIILSEYIKAHDYFNGIIVIYDFREVNVLDMVTKISPVLLQQYLTILIEGYGARLIGIHILTPSKTIDLLVKLVQQFLSEKITKRIHVHKTLEDFHKFVPVDLLPVEYGGKEKSTTELVAEWIDTLSTKEHVEYMKMMNNACTKEKLRRTSEFNQDYMGMPGSFRNLSVD